MLSTLEKMSQGGIYDNLGGGYARYFDRRALAGAAFREDALRQRQLIDLLTAAWKETRSPLFAAASARRSTGSAAR